ncbi:MAG: hypothetical protein JO056_13510 [Alphaproteobacteria bacterium]|nr:hypothetical protein [Alphaproteobacteria bacterium]
MSTALDLGDGRTVTDGQIAAINLESTRRRAWACFTQDSGAPRVAESLVDLERMVAQFLGDLTALDRLEMLARQFAHADESFRAPLLEAEVASSAHRFRDARTHLSAAARLGAPCIDIERRLLAVNQACGLQLDDVLDGRCRFAAESGKIEELVPLGALFADLERFAEADAVYRKAFSSYDGTSPFPLAWVCFQLGMLWGELVPEPDLRLAERWYQRAIAYLPGYVRARVHLAEIYASEDQLSDAEALLLSALSSCDPEVRWRLAGVRIAQGRFEEAEIQRKAARSGFESLLAKHRLAFADHAAEFYADDGNDPELALELARTNAANRPTRRAITQMDRIAKGLDRTRRSDRYESAKELAAQPNPM